MIRIEIHTYTPAFREDRARELRRIINNQVVGSPVLHGAQDAKGLHDKQGLLVGSIRVVTDEELAEDAIAKAEGSPA